MTARDEADIIERQVEWHLSQGVYRVFVAESFSTDGTKQILDRISEDRRVRVIHTATSHAHQAAEMTFLQRVALYEHCDWVLNSDADEFWVATEGTLIDAFAGIPKDVGWVGAPVDEFCADLTRLPQHRGWAGLILNPKIAHRPGPLVEVAFANTAVRNAGSHGTAPIAVLHYPIRSLAQAQRKAANLSLPVPGRAQSCDDEYNLLLLSPESALDAHGVADDRMMRILQGCPDDE